MAHDPGSGHDSHGHGHTSRKTYLVIFGLLFVLTVLEVAVAHPSLGVGKKALVSALILLALAKAGFVAYYFMHLRHELKGMKLTVVVPFLFPALYAVVLIAEAAWRMLKPVAGA